MNAWQIGLLIAVVIVAWCGFWVALVSLIGRLGGWRMLAQAYPCETHPSIRDERTQSTFNAAPSPGLTSKPLRTFSMQSMVIGRWCAYNGGVTFTAMDEGLRISVLWIFRFGHPDILLPWREMSATPGKRLVMHVVRITTKKLPDKPITISTKLAASLAAAAGAKWPHDSQAAMDSQIDEGGF